MPITIVRVALRIGAGAHLAANHAANAANQFIARAQQRRRVAERDDGLRHERRGARPRRDGSSGA